MTLLLLIIAILASLPTAEAMQRTIIPFCTPQRLELHSPTQHQRLIARHYPAPPLPAPTQRPDLLPHGFTLMSLNCNGLQPRTAGPPRPRGHYLEKRNTLAALLAEDRPTLLALQETWHMPHNDALDFPGYRWHGRTRRTATRAGRWTDSGGVGFLVSSSIPTENVKEEDHHPEAGSCGSLWLTITLQDSSKITVGTVYSETKETAARLNLDMTAVWEARQAAIDNFLARDDGHRPLFLVGDMNVHVGGFQELQSTFPRRLPLIPHHPTTSQVNHTRPFTSMARSLPLAILNGRVGGTAATCFPSSEAAWQDNWRPDHANAAHGTSTIDLALCSSAHLRTHIQSLSVRRTRHRFSDHRLLVLCACAHSPLVPGGEIPEPTRQENQENDTRLRLPRHLPPNVYASLRQALQRSTTTWYSCYGQAIREDPSPSQEFVEAAYTDFLQKMTSTIRRHLPNPRRPVQRRQEREYRNRRGLRRAMSAGRSSAPYYRSRTALVQSASHNTTKTLLRRLDVALYHSYPPDKVAAHNILRRIQGRHKQPEHFPPVRDAVGNLIHHIPGIASAHTNLLAELGREPVAEPNTTASRNDGFVNTYKTTGVSPYPPRHLPHGQTAQVAHRQRDLQRPITLLELKTALHLCKSGTAPGEDDVTYDMLKLLTDTSLSHLRVIYNAALTNGAVPQSWCTAIVRPHYKRNIHRDPEGAAEVTNYRGISLGSCVGKLLEKVLALRIQEFVSTVSPLSEQQNGFQPERCSLTHAWALNEILALRGPNALALFFDLAKAFPSVRRSSLLTALYNRGITGNLWKLVAAYYENNTSAVRLGTHTADPYEVQNGVKEGSLLSPLLFIIFIDELLVAIKNRDLGYRFTDSHGTTTWCGMLGYADDLVAIPRDVQDAQQILDICGDFAADHMISFNHSKTVAFLMRPAPDLPSYPGALQLTLREKRDSAGNLHPRLLVVRSYEYLGVLFSDTGSFLSHIRDKVLPIVEGKLRSASSTVVNHDVLNPEIALAVLNMDVLSYVRSTIAVWGTSLWCPNQPAQLKDALAELAKLFLPVLSGILATPRLSPYSKRCLQRELRWLGHDGVLIQAQLGLFRTILKMPYDRLPKRILLLLMDHLTLPTSLPSFPPPSRWEREARLPHLGREEPSLQAQWLPPSACTTLALGPATPRVQHRERRVDLLVGLTPAQSLLCDIPTRTATTRYRWTDLWYDLKHEVLIIPAYEAHVNALAGLAHSAIPSRQRHQYNGEGFNDYVRQVYPLLRRHAAPRQEASKSSFLASIQAIICFSGSSRAHNALYTDPWLLEDDHMFEEVLSGALCRLAQDIWVGDGPALPRTREVLCYYPPLTTELQFCLPPHLTMMTNSSDTAELYLITMARTGVLALGARIDDLYPPQSPFCPCCGDAVPDTYTHQLLGHCRRTRHVSDPPRQRLLEILSIMAPFWSIQYSHREATFQEQTLLLLHAPDQPHLSPDLRSEISSLLAGWLKAVISNHPLCARQSKGTHYSQLRYQQGDFDFLPWSQHDDASLLATPAHDIFSLFPGKPRASVSRRRLLLVRERGRNV